MSIMECLIALGVQPATEGGQLLLDCIACGARRKLYVDPHSGLGFCHKCQWAPNPYKFVEKLSPDKQPADIFKTLEQFGLHEPNQPAPKKPDLKDYEASVKLRPATQDEINRLAMVKKVNADTLKLLGPLMEGKGDVMALPAYDPAKPPDHTPCGYLRIHMDGSPFRDREGKERKYPQAPGSTHGLLGLPWLNEHKEGGILLTEGWRDALAAIEQGYTAIASSGGASSGWNRLDKEAWGKYFKGRDVLLVFDQDYAGHRCRRKAAQRIVLEGAKTVQTATLPYPLTATHGKDLRDFFDEGKNLAEIVPHPFLWSTIDGQTPWDFDDEPLNAYAAENYIFKDGRTVLTDDYPDTIAIAFEKQSDYPHRWHPADGWSMFKDGKYQGIAEEGQLHRYVELFAENCYYRKGKKHDRVRVTDHLLKNVTRSLSHRDGVYLMPRQAAPCSIDGSLDPRFIIALDNGLLDWSGWPPRLRSHSKEYYCRCYLPYSWHGLYRPELWMDYLATVAQGDADLVGMLQQWAGYCLMKHDQKQQKFLLMYGEAATGKSVFIDVLTHMIGKDNISNVSLADFSDLPVLTTSYGKMLNIAEENEESVLDPAVENALKRYTGGTMIQWRRLYKEAFSAYPTAKAMIVTNHLPKFKDTSEGVWRRMLLAPFNCVISEADRVYDLAERIIEKEMGGVLAWALDGARSLMAGAPFLEPDISKDEMARYRREMHPEITFIEEHTQACVKREWILPVSGLWAVYEQWCKDNGYRPKNIVNLTKSMTKVYPGIERKQRRFNGIRNWCYELTIRQDSPYFKIELFQTGGESEEYQGLWDDDDNDAEREE